MVSDCPARYLASIEPRSQVPCGFLGAYRLSENPATGCPSRVRCACQSSCSGFLCPYLLLPYVLPTRKGRERVGYRGPLPTILAEFGSRYGVIGFVASLPLQLDLRGRPSSQALLGRGFGRRSVSTGLYRVELCQYRRLPAYTSPAALDLCPFQDKTQGD